MIKHIITYHPNYNLKSYKEYNNDVLVWEENYDEDGNLHGRNNLHSENIAGILKIQVDYKHGLEHGMYKSWDDNGNKCMEGLYLNGKNHGTFKFYGPKYLYQTTEYVHGVIHGKLISYYSDGTPHKEHIYKNGILITTTKYEYKTIKIL